jgi:hypothetical protein
VIRGFNRIAQNLSERHHPSMIGATLAAPNEQAVTATNQRPAYRPLVLGHLPDRVIDPVRVRVREKRPRQ